MKSRAHDGGAGCRALGSQSAETFTGRLTGVGRHWPGQGGRRDLAGEVHQVDDEPSRPRDRQNGTLRLVHPCTSPDLDILSRSLAGGPDGSRGRVEGGTLPEIASPGKPNARGMLTWP